MSPSRNWTGIPLFKSRGEIDRRNLGRRSRSFEREGESTVARAGELVRIDHDAEHRQLDLIKRSSNK
jgi:hypothetical protein